MHESTQLGTAGRRLLLTHDCTCLAEHPARDMVGHLNPCFGWDQAPASYVAVALAGVDVFLAFRYATLEAARTRLLDMAEDTPRISPAERFSLVTSYLYACAAVLWQLLWQFGVPGARAP